MHFHLPKPLHGWREFAGEVAIIVLGVMIALGAEQVVETIHWRSNVAEARDSLDAELASEKFSSLEIIERHDCMKRKLDRLEAIVDHGKVPASTHVKLFGLRPWSTSTWEAATSSGAVAHMSPDERNRYAAIFGLVRPLGALEMKAYDASSNVSTLDRHKSLTDVSRDRLEADLAELRHLNSMLALGARQLVDEMEPLHLKVGAGGTAELAQERIDSQRCPMPDAPAARVG